MALDDDRVVRRLESRPRCPMHANLDPQRVLELPLDRLMQLLAGRLMEIHDSVRSSRPLPRVDLDDLVLVEVVLLRLGDLIEEAQIRRSRRGR